MRLITVVIIIFTLTCSGSFGMEDVLGGRAGPRPPHDHHPAVPLGVPMAFIAAELGSAIPEAGGLIRWSAAGLGEYWSFQAGWWWTLSLYVDSAVYIALTLDYLQST